jgi:hypothetical protein
LVVWRRLVAGFFAAFVELLVARFFVVRFFVAVFFFVAVPLVADVDRFVAGRCFGGAASAIEPHANAAMSATRSTLIEVFIQASPRKKIR